MRNVRQTLQPNFKTKAQPRKALWVTLALKKYHSSIKFTMEIENNRTLPFLGIQLLSKSTHVETKVYVKPTNSGLLLHYKGHVHGDRYKRGLLKTMLDRAFRLSSNWAYFSEECDRLKLLFSRLKHPDKLINSTITRFIAIKATEQPVPSPTESNSPEPVVVLPFKGQALADILRTQLKDLSQKINTTIQPVFVSHKIDRDLKLREVKPLVVNQQCLVYHFKCDLCDAGYLGFTRRHLHQRVAEHKNVSSSIGKHFRTEHSLAPKDLNMNFKILKKCKNKFDCLIYEMFFVHELRPSLNVQSDSIRAKVFK